MRQIIGIDISVLNDKQKTGIAVYAYNLIDALLKLNRQDKFILFGIATLNTYNYLKNLPFKNYPNVEMKIYKMPACFFRNIFLLWQKFNWPPIENFTGKVDIFYSFNWYFPPQKTGKKVGTVFDLTSITHPEWHDPKTTELDKIRLKRMSKMADLIIAISENSKKDFLKVFPHSNVEIVYPAAKAQIMAKADAVKTKEILQKYNINPGFILSVATLEPRKNLPGLLKAYLSSRLARPLVLVGGAGWKNQELMNLVNRHQSKIKVMGFITDEELPVFYQQAFCLIYPSFYEGFGMPVLEAMACGVPVICSNTSSLPEVGGEAVIYVNPCCRDEIKSALINLESKPNLRKALIQKGLKQAEKFSWNKSAKILGELLFGAYGNEQYPKENRRIK